MQSHASISGRRHCCSNLSTQRPATRVAVLFVPNVSPCGFVRDLGKELALFEVSDEAARRNVRHKRPISVTKKLNSIGIVVLF